MIPLGEFLDRLEKQKESISYKYKACDSKIEIKQ